MVRGVFEKNIYPTITECNNLRLGQVKDTTKVKKHCKHFAKNSIVLIKVFLFTWTKNMYRVLVLLFYSIQFFKKLLKKLQNFKSKVSLKSSKLTQLMGKF